VPLHLSLDDYVAFEQQLQAHSTSQATVLRIRIILLAAQGYPNHTIAATLGCHTDTVRQWRRRFAQHGRLGLRDQPRAGRPRCWTPLQTSLIVALICQPVAATPVPATPGPAAPTAVDAPVSTQVAAAPGLPAPPTPLPNAPIAATAAVAPTQLAATAAAATHGVADTPPPPSTRRRRAPKPRPQHGCYARTPPPCAADIVVANAPSAPSPLPQKQPLAAVLTLPQLCTQIEEQLHLPCAPSTLWRLLTRHALQPWRYQHWIFPRSERFLEQAGRILDLYAGWWAGEPLRVNEYVLSGDEKTSIQARWRCHPTLPAAQRRRARIEYTYGRGGALQYLALWDVHRGRVFGRCEPKTGIVPFDRLVAEAMGQEPYASAARVFLTVDNGSSHRGQASVQRLQGRWPNLVLVHLPVHASWLNQVEIYFSILQRGLLQPNDFQDLRHLEQAILAFQERYNRTAQPFQWRFTRAKLKVLLEKLEAHKLSLPVAS
jgi:hypothetical protein